jgi:ketosteroid isomerase-like protein
MMDDIESEIRRLEELRNRSLVIEDVKTLASLIADDIVHVHTTGVVDDKTSYLQAVTTKLKFIQIDRPQLSIRVLGNVAIATGPLNQVIQLRDTGQVIKTSAIATQVWVKEAKGWVQTSFQATRLT